MEVALGFPLGLEEAEPEVLPVPTGGARVVVLPTQSGVVALRCGSGTSWDMQFPTGELAARRAEGAGALDTQSELLLTGVNEAEGTIPVAVLREGVDSLTLEGDVRMLESQRVQAAIAMDSRASLVRNHVQEVVHAGGEGDTVILGERREAGRADALADMRTRRRDEQVGQATVESDTLAREDEQLVEQTEAAGKTTTRLEEMTSEQVDARAQTVTRGEVVDTSVVEDEGALPIVDMGLRPEWAEGRGDALTKLAGDHVRLVYRRGSISGYKDVATMFGLDGEGWLEELRGQSQVLGMDEQGFFTPFFEQGMADGFFDGEGVVIPLDEEGLLFQAEFGNLITFLAEGRRFATLWPPATVEQEFGADSLSELCVFTRRLDLSPAPYHGSLQLLEIEIRNQTEHAVEDILLAQSLPVQIEFRGFLSGDNVQPGFSRIYFPPDHTIYWRVHRKLSPGESFKAYWVVQTREWHFDPLDPENQPTTMSTQP